MAKVKISEFSANPANNTDIDGINIAENCPPSGINDAIRELMAQLKDFQAGTAGDSFNGPVGTTTAAAGAFTTLSASGAVTLSAATANGVVYANGSKVLTTGSALTFNGTTLSIGNASVANGKAFFQNATNDAYGVIGTIGGADFRIESTYGSTAGYKPITFYTNGSEQMRLTSTGLGIGTSSPDAKLQVVGTSFFGADGAFAPVGSPKTVIYGAGATETSASWFQAGVGSALVGLKASDSNFYITNTYAGNALGSNGLAIDISGNLGLGVTPSAWGGFAAFQMLRGSIAGANTEIDFNHNAYYDGSNWRYIANGFATNHYQASGGYAWRTAPSGTAGNAISFTQAMSLLSSGAWVLGDTSVVASGFAGVKFNGASFNGLGLNDSSATSGAGYVYFQSNGTTIGSITRVASTSAVAYNTTSDQRLKNDLGIVTSTDVIADTVIHDFTWKSDGSKARGVFAQEAAKTLPSAVKVGDNGEEVTDQWQVDYSKYIPDIIVELQALRARVAELEAK